jgi:hypothetical protein
MPRRLRLSETAVAPVAGAWTVAPSRKRRFLKENHMSSLRTFAALALFSVVGGTARAQTVKLEEAPLVDSCCRITLHLDLKGKITFQAEAGKTQTIDHHAVAEHEYEERVLEAKGASVEKTARVYRVARATLAGQARSLRPERGFMVAHRLKDQLIVYSPKGALTVEEMELTEHFDTLALPGLLPGKEIKIGETWPVPNNVAQDLCGFDAVEKQDLTGTLQSVQGDLAHITLHGTAKGIDLGAQVSTLIAKCKIIFSIKDRRITALEWTQSDQRQQGPASPGLSADVTIKLTRTPLTITGELNDIALALMKVPTGAPPTGLINVAYAEPQGKYVMQHGREWQFIGERQGQRVLRLITPRGDWIGDATVMLWSGPKMDAAAFKRLLEEAPGWKQDGESNVDKDVKHAQGASMVRVSAAGHLEGEQVFRSSYYLVGASGRQMIVTFVIAPKHVNSLEARDQTFVDQIEVK